MSYALRRFQSLIGGRVRSAFLVVSVNLFLASCGFKADKATDFFDQDPVAEGPQDSTPLPPLT